MHEFTTNNTNICEICGRLVNIREYMSRRIKQVNELIKRELSQIINREIDWPDGVLVTLTSVETSTDLEQARVWVSIFPFEKFKEMMKILKRERGYLQGLLNRRLIMRPLPKIQFLIDRTEEEAEKIEKIFSNSDLDK